MKTPNFDVRMNYPELERVRAEIKVTRERKTKKKRK